MSDSDFLSLMSRELLISPNRLDFLISSSPHRYKVYTIKKKSGDGRRVIAQPAREVKRIQYWVLNTFLSNLPIHEAATAYKKNANIRLNAERHSNSPYILKLDFCDFFPSIKRTDFVQYIASLRDFSLVGKDIERLVRILFWQPNGSSEYQLSIGAPSSPHISNAIMHDFDTILSEYCSTHGVTFTRYADDLTFSMQDKNMRVQVRDAVERILQELPFPHLVLNHRKTVFGSKAHRRTVTGLVLANDGSISLGREKKRLIRAKLHHHSLRLLTDDERESLQGHLAFAKSVEPDFIGRMERKYGSELLDSV